MSEEKRRDRRPLLAILITVIVATILVIGAWLWAASRPVPPSTHDVRPPEVFWEQDPTTPGNEMRSAGPIVGIADRVRPDSFDPRTDRIYVATTERLYAFATERDLDPGDTRNAWGTMHYFNVSSPGVRRTITAGPVAVNYGDYVSMATDYELYMGTDSGRLFLLRDRGDDLPSGSDVVASLDLEGAVTGIAAYNGDMLGHETIEGRAVLTSFNGTAWVDDPVPAMIEDLGEYASLAFDGTGVPHLALYHVTSGEPRTYARTVSGWSEVGQMEPYSPTVNVGQFTSLAIGSDDRPRVAYYDEAGSDLKFARWDGAQWRTEFVDTQADVGRHASLALDPLTDAPRIAYYNESGSVWSAAWSGTSWTLEEVAGGGVGMHASLALTATGEPRIAYLDEATGRIMFAAKAGLAWTTEPVATVDSGTAPVGLGERGISLRIDAVDVPHVAFRNATSSSLGYATRAGGSWSTTTVDNAGDVGLYPSLALDGSGRPAIAHHDATSVDLKYARWDGAAWDLETVRSAGLVGLYTSLAFDAAGRPYIASYEYNTSRTDRDLLVAGTASGTLYGIDVGTPKEIERGLREKHVLSWRYGVRWEADLGAEVHLAGGPLRGVTGVPLFSPAFPLDGALVFAGAASGELYAVNAATGAIAWWRPIPGDTWSSAPISHPADFGDELVVAAGDDGTLSLFDLVGNPRGTGSVADGRLLTPAASAAVGALGSSAGEAAGVRLENPPTILWSERLVGAASGNVAASDRTLEVLFGDDTGRLYSFRMGDGVLQFRAKFCDAVTAGPILGFPPHSIRMYAWFGCQDGRVFAVSTMPGAVPVP